MAEPLQQRRLFEHLRPGSVVEPEQLLHRHADGKASCDDAAGAGPGDVVEIVGKPELRPAGPQDPLDLGQDLERQHAADAAAVDRQKLLRSRPAQLVAHCHGLSSSPTAVHYRR
jgi:hypothetical protein